MSSMNINSAPTQLNQNSEDMRTSDKKKQKQGFKSQIGLGEDDYSLREIFSTLKTSVREYKKPALLTPLFVTGEVILECILPFVTAQLINAINAGAGLTTIGHYAVILLAMAVVSLACGTIAGITCSQASAGLAKNLRHDIFHAIQGFSFANIDHFSTSSLVTRLTTDVANIQLSYMAIIRTAIRSPLMILFAVVMAYITAGPLASVFVCVAVVLGFLLFYIAIKVMPIFRRIFRKYDKLNESVEENVSGIRVVKSYVREDFEKQKFNTASETLCQDFTHVERILAFNQPIMTFSIDVIYVFIIYFGSMSVISTRGELMGVGQISALITYGMSILMSLMMFSMIFVMITMSIESAQRITQVLKEKSDITSPKNPLTEVPNGQIDFDNVSFEYSKSADRMALSNIDLHIKSGQTIGIIGGTGSSKSSLVQLISRLYDVSKGTVKVGTHDVRRYDLKTLRDAVAVVLQRNVLFSGTIAENLRWGNKDASDEELAWACHIAQADEFIERLPDGYNTYIEQGGTNVSGGQKQRLCIARALLKRPKVLILDDSTSAVDTKTDKLIRKGFKSYLPETTKIIIAQRTSSVEDADLILVMNDGRIEDRGTHEELLRSSNIYREIYTTQNKQSHDDKMDMLSKEDKNA